LTRVYQLPWDYTNTIKTIIDLGANTGLASFYFQHNFPGAKIYCIEPDPGNFNQLLQNLEPGITAGHIVPLKAAIDKTDGEASLIISQMRYNSSIAPAMKGSENMVRTISMKTLVKTNGLTRIDLLKIDIEGSEQRLFENDTDWLYAVKHIFIEFHSTQIKEFCIKVLLSKNFSLYPVANKTGNTLLYRALNNDLT
jgi:FkbM family methyltransferase